MLDRALAAAVEQFDRIVFGLYEITDDELRLIRSH
jgi:hypothetical protein